MPLTVRTGLLVLSALAALAGQRLMVPERGDPCDRTPEIYACAVFLQPEWQRRSVYAGQPALQPTRQDDPAREAEALTVSVGAPHASAPQTSMQAGGGV